MSLLTSFDPTRRAVLEPSDYVSPIPGFPETVVITFQPPVMDAVAAMEGAEVLDVLSAFFKLPIYRVSYHGKTLAVYQTLMGAAGSAAILEEVIARGGRRFLLFGSCGGLEALPERQFILPTAAYRDEGVSYHYLPPCDYVDLPTAQRLGEVFDDLGLGYIKGKTWTTDGLYRETRRNVEARRAEGCLAVDMECAALAAVCAFRGVEFYQFLYTEDNLSGAAWDPGALGQMPVSAHEAHLRIALEAAARL